MEFINVTGFVGKDAEMVQTKTGVSLCSFSVAANRMRNGEKKTTWYTAKAWGKQAELVSQLVKKGAKISVVGEYEFSEFTTKDGKLMTSHDISIASFDVSKNEQPPQRPVERTRDSGADLPF